MNTPAHAKHPHYHKPVTHLSHVDVYRVLVMFNVTDPCIGHAIKKLLVAGGRGAGKDVTRDIAEAIDSLQRWQEMQAEDAMDPAKPAADAVDFDVPVKSFTFTLPAGVEITPADLSNAKDAAEKALGLFKVDTGDGTPPKYYPVQGGLPDGVELKDLPRLLMEGRMKLLPNGRWQILPVLTSHAPKRRPKVSAMRGQKWGRARRKNR